MILPRAIYHLRRNPAIAGAISGILLFASLCRAQTPDNGVSRAGTSAAAYLEIPVGAPAIAMGGAFSSIANDATSLYWNCAGSALLTKNEAVVVHTSWIAQTSFNYGALVLPLGDFGNLGFSMTSLTMGDMKVRTVEQPEGTGEYFSAQDLAAGITFARKLSDRFAIGFTGKYLRQSIWHEAAYAFAVDAGTLFRTDLLGGMVIAATLSNFGSTMQLEGRDTREFIRIDPTKTGSNDRIPVTIEMQSWALPLQFQFGVSTTVLSRDNFRWSVALDALHPADNNESMNVGTEFAWQNVFFLRAGYQSLFLSDAEGGFSFGVGLASGSLSSDLGFKADYAFRDMGRLESVHTFSLGIVF